MTNAPLPGGDAIPLDLDAYCDEIGAQFMASDNTQQSERASIRPILERLLQAQLTLARQQVTGLQEVIMEAEEAAEQAGFPEGRRLSSVIRNLCEQVTALQQEREDIHATRITWQVRAEAAEQQITALRAAKVQP